MNSIYKQKDETAFAATFGQIDTPEHYEAPELDFPVHFSEMPCIYI